MKSVYRFLAIGLELTIFVLVGLGVGTGAALLINQKEAGSQLFEVGGSLLGMAVGFWRIWKTSKNS